MRHYGNTHMSGRKYAESPFDALTASVTSEANLVAMTYEDYTTYVNHILQAEYDREDAEEAAKKQVQDAAPDLLEALELVVKSVPLPSGVINAIIKDAIDKATQ